MGKMRAEVKLLKDIEKAKGEWRISHDGGWGDGGRRQSKAIIKVKKSYYVGLADCSHEDNFNRKLGRVIALGRAWKAYKQHKPTRLTKAVKQFIRLVW